MKNLIIQDSAFLKKIQTFALAAIVLGALGSAAAAMFDLQRFMASYLVGFLYVGGIAITALFFTAIQFLVQAGYAASYRRIIEFIASFVPFLIIGLIPIVVDVWAGHKLYHWTHPGVVEHDPVLQAKASYLNPVFFTIRIVMYYVVWFIIHKFIVGNSFKQDTSDNYEPSKKNMKWGAVSVIFYALSSTFAAFDLLMSLDPHWFSTMFGVYFFAGNFVSTISLVTVFVVFLHREGHLDGYVQSNHLHDLGKFMFAFTVFWAYIGFSQYMLIWYGNLTEETLYFIRRTSNGWEVFAWGLLFLHFIFPFALLIQQHVKRNTNVLLIGAFTILIMHFIDLSWLVLPELSKDAEGVSHFRFGWQEISAWLLCIGVFLTVVTRQFKSKQAIAAKDPFIQESVHLVS